MAVVGFEVKGLFDAVHRFEDGGHHDVGDDADHAGHEEDDDGLDEAGEALTRRHQAPGLVPSACLTSRRGHAWIPDQVRNDTNAVCRPWGWPGPLVGNPWIPERVRNDHKSACHPRA